MKGPLSIGRFSFDAERLRGNAAALMDALMKAVANGKSRTIDGPIIPIPAPIIPIPVERVVGDEADIGILSVRDKVAVGVGVERVNSGAVDLDAVTQAVAVGVDDVRVGAEESRGSRHELAVLDGEVQGEVVPFRSPAPGSRGVRLAEDGEVVLQRIAASGDIAFLNP